MNVYTPHNNTSTNDKNKPITTQKCFFGIFSIVIGNDNAQNTVHDNIATMRDIFLVIVCYRNGNNTIKRKNKKITQVNR